MQCRSILRKGKWKGALIKATCDTTLTLLPLSSGPAANGFTPMDGECCASIGTGLGLLLAPLDPGALRPSRIDKGFRRIQDFGV
jgi:hypothetical protein